MRSAAAAVPNEADKAAEEARRAWVAPVIRKLLEWKRAGVPLATMRERLNELCPNTAALAAALGEVFARGLRGESVEPTKKE